MQRALLALGTSLALWIAVGLKLPAAAQGVTGDAGFDITWDAVGVDRDEASERAGGGTLPLRLRGGDGTLPLRFSGQATDLADSQAVGTGLVLTSVEQRAMPVGQAAALRCELRGETISKHAAAGSVSIGDARYAIVGICYDPQSLNMEIVAAGAGEQTRLMSRLTSAEPRTLTGRLTVLANDGLSGRYAVSLRSSDPQPE